MFTFLSVAEKEKPSEIALKNLYSVAMILHPPMLSIVYYYPWGMPHHVKVLQPVILRQLQVRKQLCIFTNKNFVKSEFKNSYSTVLPLLHILLFSCSSFIKDQHSRPNFIDDLDACDCGISLVVYKKVSLL